MTAPNPAPPGAQLGDWVAGVTELVDAGFDYLDLLTVVDWPDAGEFEVVIHLVNGDAQGVFAHTRIDREAPVLDSLVGILPPANWHERELAEMFGVTMTGHPEPTRLLLADSPVAHPLRKDVPLPRRQDRPWPGAKPEPGRRSRRTPRPHGAPEQPDRDG